MIRQSAEIICEELLDDMKTPDIIFTRIPEMQTATTKAMAVLSEAEEPKIYIDPSNKVDPTLVMVIGHELRHVYQFYVKKERSELERHMNSSDVTTEEYNLQLSEVDANAFGQICQEQITGTRPLWFNLSEKVKNAISARREQILKDEFGCI